MRPHILILFIFSMPLALLCAGQSNYPSKKTIKTLLKRSISQESSKKIQVGNNAWSACNMDNAFFTRDTIVFDNSNSLNCCAMVQWTFYKKDAFVQNMAQTCKEPSSSIVAKAEDFYTIDIIDENTSLVIRTSNRVGKQTSFRVVSADKDSRSIKLVRIKKENL